MEQENLLAVLAAQRLPNAEKLKDLRAALLSERNPRAKGSYCLLRHRLLGRRGGQGGTGL